MENVNIDAAKNKPFLSLQHLEKIYPNGEKAVYDFNLDVQKKDFIVIVGPSGCGKSTTLRMIAGLEDITSGDIFLESELLNYRPSKDRKMAIVFQSYALYPQMNVFQNIAFPLTINKYPAPVVDKELYPFGEVKALLGSMEFAKVSATLAADYAVNSNKKERMERLAAMFGISPEAADILAKLYLNCGGELSVWLNKLDEKIAAGKAKLAANGIRLNDNLEVVGDDGQVKIELRKLTPYEIKIKVYETAETLDLKPYLDKLPKELSGGQMQRVALGRAIIKNVPVFMMDEPLSNLDAKLRLTMRSEIVKLHNRINATTVYVTHDQTEAMTMATRIVVMSRGFIQQIGTPAEVYNDPANVFVARFIGSPTMNLFDGQFNREDGTFLFGSMKISLDSEFTKKHDAFYQSKIKEFTDLINNFDVGVRENILKLLSVTGENKNFKAGSAKKKNIFARLKEKFKKDKINSEEYAYEKDICIKKLEQLSACLNENHTLTIGIRPERVKIEKIGKSKKAVINSFTAKPTVCELLGGDYNVHFDFCNMNMVAVLDAKHSISPEDEVTVCFSPEDLYVFDPITGDVIK